MTEKVSERASKWASLWVSRLVSEQLSEQVSEGIAEFANHLESEVPARRKSSQEATSSFWFCTRNIRPSTENMPHAFASLRCFHASSVFVWAVCIRVHYTCGTNRSRWKRNPRPFMLSECYGPLKELWTQVMHYCISLSLVLVGMHMLESFRLSMDHRTIYRSLDT
jgi:hypothetical protein